MTDAFGLGIDATYGSVPVMKYGSYIMVSRELFEEPKPTDEDRARWARRAAAEKAYHAAVRAAVESCDDPKLAALCQLHGPVEQTYYPNLVCEGCPADGEYGSPEWPCATALLLGDLLGVHEPEDAK